MGRLRSFARAIRHAPVLRHADWLWDRLRPAYHAVLNRDSRGVAVTVGGNLAVRMPAEFFKRLGVEEPSKEGEYFVSLDSYLKNRTKLTQQGIGDVRDQLVKRASENPWPSPG